MTHLTIHILINRQHEETLRHTLESVICLPATILAGMLCNSDKITSICQEFGAKIVRVSGNNRSNIRNSLLETANTPWHLWIEPWEFIIDGHQAISEVISQNQSDPYRIRLFEKELITKPTRLWASQSLLRWTNPVYETLSDTRSQPLPTSIWSSGCKDKNRDELLKNWYQTKPTETDPPYYMACACLSTGQYQEFLTIAEQYLFRQRKATIAATMIRYYVGMVQCYYARNLPESLQQVIHCLAQHPLMAEFWCLLGDIHVQGHNYKKAITFYENGLILGAKRLQDDTWPIHLDKYKAYPEDMIAKCRIRL